MMYRSLIINGPPGAGKTTLARKLSPLVGLGIIEKDSIKEALADSLGFGTPEQHQRLKKISFEIMARLLADSGRLIAVANFPHEFRSLVGSDAQLAEIHCQCNLDTSRQRFGSRGHRHDVHPPVTLTDQEILPYMEPLGIGPIYRVNTENPVDMGGIISWLDDINFPRQPIE